MSRITIQFVALVALCIVSFVTVSFADDEEWKQYHYKLFTNDGPAIGYEKTVELLNKLHELYHGITDDATLRRAERIEMLRGLLDISENNCNDQYLDEVKLLLDQMTAYRKNLYTFVQHQRDLQFEMCRKYATHKLEEALSHLSAEDKENIEALVDNIDKGNESRYYCEEKDNLVNAGLMSYLESREGRLVEKVSKPDGHLSRSLVSSLVEKSIEGLCERVVATIGMPLEYYDRFDSSDEAKKRQDALVSGWYHTKRVCHHLYYHMNDLKEGTYKGIKFTEGLDDNSSLKSKFMKMINH